MERSDETILDATSRDLQGKPAIRPVYFGNLHHKMYWQEGRLGRFVELVNPSRDIEIRNIYDPPRFGYSKGLISQTYTPPEISVTIGEEGDPSVVHLNDQMILARASSLASSEVEGRKYVREISFLTTQGLREIIKREKLQTLRPLRERLSLYGDGILLSASSSVLYALTYYFMSETISHSQNGNLLLQIANFAPGIISVSTAVGCMFCALLEFDKKPQVPLDTEAIFKNLRELFRGYLYLARHGGELVTYHPHPMEKKPET